MSFSEEAYLQIIDNWIQCEDKIVTYTHLALELGVPCNQAKAMLYSYVQKARSTPSHPVLPIYLISGYLTSDELLVKLVPEKELESTKSQFTRILSLHIYSICKYTVTKAKSIYTSLTLITQDRTSNSQLSLIKNSHIKRRTLKYKSAPKDLPVNTKSETKEPSKPKIIATKNEVKESIKPVTHPLKKQTNAKPKKNIGKLQFSTESPASKKINSIDKSLEKIVLNSQLQNSDESSSESSESEIELKTRGYIPLSLPTELTQRPKVTGFLEDDSDDELMAPIDDVIETTHTEKQEKNTVSAPSINPVTGKKRKRIQRIVSEHHEDANGFLVTKKKFVMVSTDESDSEDTASQQTTAQTKTTSTKQSSLNAFFKK